MNVIVHYPKSPKEIHTLQKQVAMIHAQAVISYILKLSCPKEQKVRLLKGIIDSLRNQCGLRPQPNKGN